MAFGGYDLFSAFPLDSMGQLTVVCDAPTPVRISMGSGTLGRLNPRVMVQRGAELRYDLFLDAAHTIVWGDGSSGTVLYEATLPAGATVTIPVFGRVFAGQRVPPGAYTDRIFVNVIF